MALYSLSIPHWRHAIDCALAIAESDEKFYALLYILSEVEKMESPLEADVVTLPERQQKIIFG